MRIILVLLAALMTSSCISTSDGKSISAFSRSRQEGESERAVVIGLWLHDEVSNRRHLIDKEGHPTEALLSRKGDYLIAVGQRKRGHFALVQGALLLPPGWKHAQAEVIDDGMTVNIGDVVDYQFNQNTGYEVTAIVRKCNAAPLRRERKEWGFGCVVEADFNRFDYAGVGTWGHTGE